MNKKVCVFLALIIIVALGGCANKKSDTSKSKEVEIQVFVAASLNTVTEEIVKEYNKENPNVKVRVNADSSGKLLTQIQEGYSCDLFFSAAEKQVNTLEKDGLTIEDTRVDVLRNKVCLIALADKDTEVTSLATVGKAKSIALAGSAVPVGEYTRMAMENLGIIQKSQVDKPLTASEISKELGGVSINECGNVSAVLQSVLEGASEVGTVYRSDILKYQNKVNIIEIIDSKYTGEVVYPMVLVKNVDANKTEEKEARKFYDFMLSDKAKTIYIENGFVL